jgi:hypothetical protein
MTPPPAMVATKKNINTTQPSSSVLHTFNQGVELFITTNGELQVAGSDTLDFIKGRCNMGVNRSGVRGGRCDEKRVDGTTRAVVCLRVVGKKHVDTFHF